MKRLFKILGTLLLAIIFIVGLAATFIHLKGIPSYEVGHVNLKVNITPQRIANGQKMASVLCVECHLNDEGKLIGKLLPDLPKEFGKIYSKNITNHPTAGIGNWTDGELYYLLRTGVRKDGQYLPPYMVKFPNMSEEDIFDIIAWLRSEKPIVQGIDEEAPDSEPSFLTKMLCQVAFKPLPLNPNAILAPDTSNHIGYGKYLSTAVYQCYACHSKDFKTNNDLQPELSEGYYAGGNQLLNKKGEIIPSVNITFDETGIAKYTLADFTNLLRNGKRLNGSQVRYPMIPYTQLSDQEITAIYEYLQSVPKIKS